MNHKIERVRADIRKTENRLKEYDEYLKTLKAKERQLENEEIVARIRGMQEKGSDILDVLDEINSGKGSGLLTAGTSLSELTGADNKEDEDKEDEDE